MEGYLAHKWGLLNGLPSSHPYKVPLYEIDENGTLTVNQTFDYETDDRNYTITVRATDDLNASFDKNFTITLTNVFEDLDGDGTEDHYDEDTDGDGFRDSLEASTGSNLNDPHSTPLQQGLVAWYPFDGNASDMSGNGNHGTVNGATLGTDRHGFAGKAYSFDGVDDNIELNKYSYPVGDQATISFWANRDPQIASQSTLIGPGEYLRVHLNWDAKVYFDYNDGSSPGSADRIFYIQSTDDSGLWNLWCWTRNKTNNTLRIFLNGKLIKEDKSQILKASGNRENIEQIKIGSETNGGNPWKGILDELKIYDRALSADEISVLYNDEKPKINCILEIRIV